MLIPACQSPWVVAVVHVAEAPLEGDFYIIARFEQEFNCEVFGFFSAQLRGVTPCRCDLESRQER